jgi:hypothetical protein
MLHTLIRLLALSTNIRLGRKYVKMANAIAYYAREIKNEKKSF